MSATPAPGGIHAPASRLRVHSAMFVVAFFFSANYVISKLGMKEFAPLAFAWLRVCGAALVLAAFARREAPISRDDRRLITKFAILGVVINQSMFLGGLALTTVPVAAILITTIPVFALATAIVMGTERATIARAAGIALACAGALLVVGGESISGTWRSVLGAAMIVINCLSYAIYLVISKPVMARLSARAMVARMFATGAVLLLPVSAWSLWKQDWAAVSPRAWLALALVIAGPTVGAYLLNAWSLRHVDSSVVAAYTYLQPVLAALLGALFLGEHVRPIVVAAAVLIFAGVALAGRASAVPPAIVE